MTSSPGWRKGWPPRVAGTAAAGIRVRAPANPVVGNKLLAALSKTAGLPSLSPDTLRRTLQPYPAEVQGVAEPLFQRLHQDAQKQQARLAEFESVLHGGDARQGRNSFFGSKAACSTCHTAGTEGGTIGPDLSKIGGIRTGRDLLEAILFPSSSFVRSYEPYVLATTDGRTYNGTLGRDTADAVILVTTDRTEIRVPARPSTRFSRARSQSCPRVWKPS